MYRLSDALPYRLNRLGSRLGRLFTRRIAQHEMTIPMYQVLASLSERPNQKLGDLAATTSTILPTMSRMVGLLVQRGLISRERDPGNERLVRINLTEAGQALAAELLGEAAHYEEVVTSSLTADEIAQLKRLLDRMYAALDHLEAELPPEA